MTEERSVMDEMADGVDLLDQWDKKLKETPGDADAKGQIRNWAIPMFRKIMTIIEGVATDLVEDVDDQISEMGLRVDEVSSLARATLASHGMVQILALTHEFARRVAAADIGEETQEIGQQLLELTAPHAAALQAVSAEPQEPQEPAGDTEPAGEPPAPANGQGEAGEPQEPTEEPPPPAAA